MNNTQQIQDNLTFKGQIHFRIRRADGTIRDEWDVKNLVVNVGKAAALTRLVGLTMNAFTYLALGTSSNAPAAGQTALGTEITTGGLARASITPTQTTTTFTGDTAVLDYQWTASSGFTIQEIGVFNAASAGTMFSRALTGAKVIVSGEKLEATYSIITP